MMDQPKTVELNNPEVAAKYSCTKTVDCIVHVPHSFRGLLSEVTLKAADEMVAQGYKHLHLKQAPPAND
jgi:hypothetical protein